MGGGTRITVNQTTDKPERTGTMNRRLGDTRKMDSAEADRIMKEVAELEVDLVKTSAKYEQRIQDIKEEAEKMTAPMREIILAKAEMLQQFIENNLHQFRKPKSRKTPFGAYGRRSVAGVRIDDPKKVIKFAKSKKLLHLVKVTESVDKAAARKEIEEGRIIPGARIIKGEESFYRVDQRLLDDAAGMAV